MAARISLSAGSGPRRQYGFALTPLADAMFQLLIFFMLSSTLSPFSLMTLTSGQIGDEAASPPATAQTDTPIWQLSRGQVRIAGATVALQDLTEFAKRLAAQGTSDVVVLPTQSATVQDVASVMEALGAAGIDRVRLMAGSRISGG